MRENSPWLGGKPATCRGGNETVSSSGNNWRKMCKQDWHMPHGICRMQSCIKHETETQLWQAQGAGSKWVPWRQHSHCAGTGRPVEGHGDHRQRCAALQASSRGSAAALLGTDIARDGHADRPQTV